MVAKIYLTPKKYIKHTYNNARHYYNSKFLCIETFTIGFIRLMIKTNKSSGNLSLQNVKTWMNEYHPEYKFKVYLYKRVIHIPFRQQ